MNNLFSNKSYFQRIAKNTMLNLVTGWDNKHIFTFLKALMSGAIIQIKERVQLYWLDIKDLCYSSNAEDSHTIMQT